MITHDARRSLSRGNNPVPSPWLATVRWRATRQTPAPAWCRCWTSWPITERAGFAADERLERTSYPGEVTTRRGYPPARRQS